MTAIFSIDFWEGKTYLIAQLQNIWIYFRGTNLVLQPN